MAQRGQEFLSEKISPKFDHRNSPTIVQALRQADLREYQLYAITLPDVYIVNNTELVGLQDYRAQTISIEWFPTLSALFREERQLRELFRVDAEQKAREFSARMPQGTRTIRKEIMYYMLHAISDYQKSNTAKVRDRYRKQAEGENFLRHLKRKGIENIRNFSNDLCSVARLRAKLKLPIACLSPFD
ncbi:hypothetical protein GGR55DRAFT_679643 [Xylaria sp. FL0064]|nr:hypothetical protein GGR55DRAFT_679643 [Xylaria sp. FL0064]